jgi:fumarate reductase flavoprotein subunit
LFFISFITVVLLFVLGGCDADNSSNSNIDEPEPFSGNPSGTGSGSIYGYGGFVSVDITMVDGWITEVIVTGPNESDGIGKVAVAKAPDIIKQKNSVDIDTLAGASVTTTAIQKAGQQAIAEIIAAQ